MKKILALVLALILALGMCTVSFAEEFTAVTLDTDKPIPEGLKIAFAYVSFSDKLGSQYKNSIQYLCDAFNVEAIFFELGNGGDEAVSAVESVLAAGDVDGLIVAGATSPAYVAAADKYGAAYVCTGGFPATEEEIASCTAYDCFLGGLLDDDAWAGEQGIEALYAAGCRNICYSGITKGLVSSHDARAEGMHRVVEKYDDLNLLAENYTMMQFSSDIPTFVAAYPELDGYGFSACADSLYMTFESEGIADGSVKMAAVDISSETGTYFENGVMAWTCGGQYGTAMMAFSVLYNYLADGTRIIADPAVPMMRPYIGISSYEDYENYAKYVENPLPVYDANEIMNTIHYFNEEASVATFEEYAANYSLADIVARHGDKIE
ncbi:MAG: hypothetical protein GX650_01930 [Clostridiales bacterium]|nr:hypothetical protein [Clostridiales bacterium]